MNFYDELVLGIKQTPSYYLHFKTHCIHLYLFFIYELWTTYMNPAVLCFLNDGNKSICFHTQQIILFLTLLFSFHVS